MKIHPWIILVLIIFVITGVFTWIEIIGGEDNESETVVPQVTVILLDIDRDGIANNADNCEFDPNPGQEDADFDGLGDVCDPAPDDQDADADNWTDDVDNCPLTFNPDQQDWDGNGLGDVCDDSSGPINGPTSFSFGAVHFFEPKC